MRALLSSVVVAGFASAAAASPAFIEATSELDEGKPATAMWNVVDDSVNTVWCSHKETDGKQAINFTFEDSVTVTHIGLMFPHAKDGAVDKTNKRPKIVFVADVGHRVEAKFKDTPDMQVLELTPPAKGNRVVVEFDETWPGVAADAPICVAEVVLKNKNKELSSELAAKARGMNTPARKLLHQWHDDLSAPTRTLLFNVDGTFHYRFTPLLDDQKPAKVKGKWSAGASTLNLEVGGKSYSLQTRLTKIDDGDDPHTELALSGEAPHPSMIETFKPAPLLLP
ncbi:MAG: hypothetical protein Q8O67_20685 [Deltaproteobacteria bacterium]|nr:hypothetical protein [Deltaproteobacteria bacterium]